MGKNTVYLDGICRNRIAKTSEGGIDIPCGGEPRGVAAPLPSTAVFKINVDVHQVTAESVISLLNQEGNDVELQLSPEEMQQYRTIVENYGAPADLQRNILTL